MTTNRYPRIQTPVGALALVAVLCTAAPPAAAKDWPQWRGPARDGKSAETGVIRNWNEHPPKLRWIAEGMGGGYASVAVVGGRIYTTGDLADGQGVIAADAKDGKVLWRTSVSPKVPRHSYPGARSTPTVDGDRLYATTSDGWVACLDTGGKVLWKKSFEEEWGGRLMSGWGRSSSWKKTLDMASS